MSSGSVTAFPSANRRLTSARSASSCVAGALSMVDIEFLLREFYRNARGVSGSKISRWTAGEGAIHGSPRNRPTHACLFFERRTSLLRGPWTSERGIRAGDPEHSLGLGAERG